jgi:general secretion pathway protein L
MVSRITLAPALAALDAVGLKAHFVEVGPTDRPTLLAVGGATHRTAETFMVRGLAGACAALAAVALLLPLGLQAFALYKTESAIAELRPTLAQVERLRRESASDDAERGILTRELERTGNVLQTLATVTRILPDDTFLTDFSLLERQMTLSGRSALAPRLITGLSADPAIRNTAFAAPVTRIEGGTADVFSIKAEIAK